MPGGLPHTPWRAALWALARGFLRWFLRLRWLCEIGGGARRGGWRGGLLALENVEVAFRDVAGGQFWINRQGFQEPIIQARG
jgi:hypothetical protein